MKLCCFRTKVIRSIQAILITLTVIEQFYYGEVDFL